MPRASGPQASPVLCTPSTQQLGVEPPLALAASTTGSELHATSGAIASILTNVPYII
jgi:hypothetical protein